MGAIKSLRRAISALLQNPVLFLAGFVFALVALPGSAISLLQQAGVAVPGGQFLSLPLGIVSFLITPFLVAGLVGMVRESFRGSTSLGTFVDSGRSNYLTMLLAFLARFAIMLVIGIVLGIVGIVLGLVVGIGAIASVGGGGAPGAAVGGVTILLLGGFAVLAVLLFVAVGLLLEFLPAAVVLDGDGPIDALRSSAGVVLSNKLSAVGYLAVRIAVGLIVALPTSAFVLLRTVQRFQTIQSSAGPGGPDPAQFGAALFSVPEAVALVVVGFAVSMLVTPFRLAYMTTFYDDHSDGGRRGDVGTGTRTDYGVEA